MKVLTFTLEVCLNKIKVLDFDWLGGQNMRKVKHKKRHTGIGTIVVVVLLICSIVSFKRFSLDSERDESEKRLTEVKAAIKEEEERTKEIEDYKAYVQTKKYVEEVAREKLGLVYEDEIIFKSED